MMSEFITIVGIVGMTLIGNIPFLNLFHTSYAINNILINEVELNPPGNDKSVAEWVELYNTNNYSIDISGWKIKTTSGDRTSSISIPDGTLIPPQGYFVIESGSQWLDNSNEIVVLIDNFGNEIDRVGPFSDSKNDNNSWQRYPNGSEEWSFLPSTYKSVNGENIQSKTNSPPIANAGPDFVVNEGERALLDGSLSFDPDSDPLSYYWKQILGPEVQIYTPNSVKASFILSEVTSDSILIFSLIVRDPSGASSEDTVTVIVKNIKDDKLLESFDKESKGQLKIIFIDVGQGESTLIILPNNKSMLIDGGESEDSDKVLEVLRENNIEKIDVVIATHPHADHIGGLIDIINNVEVGKVLDSGQVHTTKTFEDLIDAIDMHNIPLISVYQGYEIDLDPNVDILVINPPTLLEGADDPEEFNDNGVVIKVRYGEFSALLPADIEAKAENRLAEMDIDVDLLVSPHHGSKGSNTLSFLKAASPEVIIISVGADNPYGHPHQEALDRMRSIGVEHIFRTDIDGSIVVTSDGSDEYIIETETKSVVVPEFNAIIPIAALSISSLIIMRIVWKSLKVV